MDFPDPVLRWAGVGRRALLFLLLRSPIPCPAQQRCVGEKKALYAVAVPGPDNALQCNTGGSELFSFPEIEKIPDPLLRSGKRQNHKGGRHQKKLWLQTGHCMRQPLFPGQL